MHTVLSLMLFLFTQTLVFATANPALVAYQLPYDQYIGQVVEPIQGSAEWMTQKALGEQYSLAWIETYVPQALAQGFVFTYQKQLSPILPAEHIQLGKAVERGELYEVPFICTDGPSLLWGTFVWMKEAQDGDLQLVSLSFERQAP